MKQLQQKGFSVIEVLLVLIVLSLIGFIGWIVYDATQKEPTTTQQSITSFEECKAAGYPIAESYPEQCHANGKSFTNNKAIETQPGTNEYFEIKELGVKFKTTDDLKGLYYYMGNDTKSAYFSTAALKNTSCAADKTAQIAISRYKESELPTQGAYSRPEDRQKLGDYYFIVAAGQAGCAEGGEVQEKANILRTELFKAAKNKLEAL